MKTEHKIGAAVAVLLALGGAFWATRNSAKAERESHVGSSAVADLPAISLPKEEADKITKLEFKNADKEAIVLEKKGDAWEITAPIQAKANKADVKTLLDGLKDLKTSDVIDRTAAGYAQYDLADGKGVKFTAYKGADKALDLQFGASGTRGQMVRVAGRDGIWVAQGYQAHLYTKEVKNWRDKSVLEFEDVNVASVEVENENGKFIFTKAGDNWSGTFNANPNRPKKEEEKKADKKPEEKKAEGDKKPEEKKPEGEKKAEAPKEKKEEKKDKAGGWEKFDGKKVEDLLRAFKKLNAIDFADKDSETGLGEGATPAATVTITFKDGKSVKLLVGKTQKGTNRFVKKADDPTVWVISSWSADWATADEKKFEKKDEKKDGPPGGDPHGDDHGMPGMPEGLDMEDLQMPDE